MNCFLDNKAALFDQPPSGLSALLMPEANRLLLCVDRRSDILTTPLRTEPPYFVQQPQRTTRVDFAQRRASAGRQRQAPLWDQTPEARSPLPHPRTTSDLNWAPARERGRIILMHIPAPEERGFGFDLVAIAERVARPKGANPEAVKGFDLIVALGFVVGSEQRLDPAKQAQAHDLTQYAPRGVPTAKGAVVVDLEPAGTAQCRPG